MKTIKTNKLDRVEVPQDDFYTAEGIVAVQLVEFEINFFGHEETFTLDTKILNDGRQLVVDGNGWIPSGTEVE